MKKITVKYIDTTVYDVQIWTDDDPESPRDWDNLGTMVCWHNRYNLGDKHDYSDTDEFFKEHDTDKTFMLPLYLYDHSGITMSTGSFNDRWDSGQVGFIYVDIDKAKEEFPNITDWKKLKARVYKTLEQEVKTYAQYLEGGVYGVEITAAGQEPDSCWGLYGIDGVRDFIKDEIGEAKYNASGILADYL